MSIYTGGNSSTPHIYKNPKEANCAQGPSLKVFVKKKVQRCGVWQIKPMTSLDPDPLSMKSNNSGFGGYSQMKYYKGCKNG